MGGWIVIIKSLNNQINKSDLMVKNVFCFFLYKKRFSKLYLLLLLLLLFSVYLGGVVTRHRGAADARVAPDAALPACATITSVCNFCYYY